MQGQNVIIASDMHVYGSPRAVTEPNLGSKFYFIGDLNGRYENEAAHKRELTYEIEQSMNLSKEGAIQYATENLSTDFMKQLYKESVITRLNMHDLDTLLEGSQNSNTGGNSALGWSKALQGMNAKFGFNVTTPQDYINSSTTLRNQKSVEYETIENTLFISMPYDESKSSWDQFAKQLDNIVNEIERNGPKDIVFMTHEYSDPESVFGTSNLKPVKMGEIIQLYLQTLREAAPDSEISFVGGHLHKSIEPYVKDGIAYYLTGWIEGTDTMRVLEIDPRTGEKTYRDYKIDVSDEELEFLDRLVEKELDERGYLSEIKHQLNGDSEEADLEEAVEEADAA